jgi:hypothetical protein
VAHELQRLPPEENVRFTMLDITQNIAPVIAPQSHSGTRPVLRYRSSDDTEGTAGSMPVWEHRSDAETEIAANIGNAASAASAPPPDFATTLAYAQEEAVAETGAGEEFGFGDLIDMVNPLQHIPIVNVLYRDLTGDRIGPAARVIGGTLYGGPIGGGAALVNIAVEYETGRDVTGNMVAMVTEGKAPSYRSIPDRPEQRLAAAAQPQTAPANLPGSVLSFADLGGGRQRVVESFVEDDMERTAGTMVRRYVQAAPAEPLNFLPPREPITTLSFGLPKKEENTD